MTRRESISGIHLERCRLAHSEDHQHQLLQISSLGEEHPLVIRYSCNCSYSVYLMDRWIDDRQYVDVVSKYFVCLRVPPNVSSRVVVRVGDSCVGSSVVHPPYVGLAWARARRR